MSDRTVAVRLLARVDSYKAGMKDAAQATRTFTGSAQAAMKRTATELENVSTESTIVGGALLGMAALSVVASARFDKSMSKVAAVSNANVQQMNDLRQAAIDAGKATVFSASEAADAEAELAKAGVSTSDILGGALTGSLDLAAAGQLELADSATIAAQAMNVFDLKGRDVAHIADVLAAGANKSAADVGQLGQALQQGGLLAKQTGLDLEDTVGVLSLFADNALVGSDAGTSLKTMLMRLTPQSEEAASMMQQLGIEAYDASGNFIGLQKWAGKLQDGMKDLTPEARNAALNIIFGSDAARAAGVIYDAGAKGVQDYTTAVNDQGAASRMAAIQLDNLAGDYEQLSGSIETAFIKSGTGANDLLRKMTQEATNAVNFIGDLPAPILAVGVAAATAGGAFFVAAPRIAAFNAALALSPGLSKAAARGFKLLGPALAVTAIAGIALDMHAANEELTALEQNLGDVYRALGEDVDTSSIDTLRSKIRDLQNVVNDPGPIRYFKQGLAMIFGQDGEITRSQDILVDATRHMADYQAAVGEVAFALGVDFNRAMQLIDESGVGLNGTTQDVVAGVREYVTVSQEGGAASHTAADGMDTLADSTASAEEQLKAYNDTWDATIGMLLGVSDAQIAAERALSTLTESLKKNGNSWDISTKKGQENRSAFNDLISAAGRVAQAKLEETNDVDAANKAYKSYLDRLLKAPGLTDKQRTALKKLISEGYDKLPKKPVETKVTADTADAEAKLDRLLAKLRTIDGYKAVYGVVGSVDTAERRVNRASGGFVYGPGTSTSDSINARLSNGEHVTRASIAQANRPLMTAINDGRLADAYRYLGASLTAPQTAAAPVAGSTTFGPFYVTPVAGEPVTESIPRAARKAAFVLGMGA